MKNLILVVAVAVFFANGCAAYFGNEAQYKDGEWNFLASSQEVARIQRDKVALEQQKVYDQLAVEKLKSQPADIKVANGAVQGFKGIVQNLSQRRANIVLQGPETQSFFLRPGEKIETFLLPGSYYAMTYLGNRPADNGRFFTVGAPKYVYQGKEVHWYVYYDP